MVTFSKLCKSENWKFWELSSALEIWTRDLLLKVYNISVYHSLDIPYKKLAFKLQKWCLFVLFIHLIFKDVFTINGVVFVENTDMLSSRVKFLKLKRICFRENLKLHKLSGSQGLLFASISLESWKIPNSSWKIWMSYKKSESRTQQRF